jgi:hypothetical protein
MKLYEITDEFRLFEDLLEQNGGEITPEMELQLGELEIALPEKVENIAGLIREKLAYADAAVAERNRLDKLANAAANVAFSLQNYLKRNLEEMGVNRVATERFVVRVQKNSRPAIKWVGGNPPQEYQRLEPARLVPDMEHAYNQWKAGEELPEGFVVEHGTHLRIQ